MPYYRLNFLLENWKNIWLKFLGQPKPGVLVILWSILWMKIRTNSNNKWWRPYGFKNAPEHRLNDSYRIEPGQTMYDLERSIHMYMAKLNNFKEIRIYYLYLVPKAPLTATYSHGLCAARSEDDLRFCRRPYWHFC